jgi:hypothetical protein
MMTGHRGNGPVAPPGCGSAPAGNTSGVNNNCYMVGAEIESSGSAVWSGNLPDGTSCGQVDGPTGVGTLPNGPNCVGSHPAGTPLIPSISHINISTDQSGVAACVRNGTCATEVTDAANGRYNSAYASTLANSFDPVASQLAGIVIDNEWSYTWQTYGPFGGGGGEGSPQYSCATWNAGVQNLINAIRADHNLDNTRIGMFPPLDNTAETSGCGNVTGVDYVDYHLYEGSGCGSTASAAWNGFCQNELQFVDGYASRKGKPYTFSEWCSYFPDPYMIQQMQTWINTHNVIFHGYWDDQSLRDSGIAGNNWCALNGSSAKLNAFTSAWPPTYIYTGTFWAHHP